MDNITWDEIYISMAHLFAMKSKDRSTKSGVVIVDQYNRVKSLGFNGFPTGIDDDIEERHERPAKYLYTEHSERNAIYNSSEDLTGCKLYVNWHPCADCARAIIQKRIVEVIIHKEFEEYEGSGNWSDAHEIAKILFKEAGVKVRYWSGKVLQIQGLKNGKVMEI